MATDQRDHILAEFAHYTGCIMPAAFFRNTSEYIPGVDRIHPLMTGIYKPAWSEYALCIKMAPGSPYEHKDEVVFLDDGRWLMTYSPRSGGLEISDNRALMRCMDDHVPLAVIQQVTDKTKGSTYRVLGLGIISSFDTARDVFIVESADWSALQTVAQAIPDEAKRYEMQLYAQLTNEFRPFVQEDRASYLTSMPKRDEAFREVLLNEYDFACAICEMKFKVDDLYEAQAAHSVPKRRSGTDDPRNGLALCRALRDQRALPDRIPLFLHLAEHPTRAERLMALRAGAWDVLAPPLDAEEMILRLEAYVRAKQDADRAQERGLVDATTHFYNAQGLEARASELAAWAQRSGEPLSCVVLEFVRGGTVDDAEVARAIDAMSDVLRRTGRTSDAIGRTGQTEFAVLAPGADGTAAVRLAERLAAALRPVLSSPAEAYPAVELRGGYDAVADGRETPLKGHELITRATIAFNRARSIQNGLWLRPFQPAAPTLL